MKLNLQTGRSRSIHGIFLLDCLVYMGLFTLVLGMAFAAFYTAWDNSRALHRNASDIARAVETGERWREDVRQSVSRPELVETAAGVSFRLQLRADIITYTFENGRLWRVTDSTGRKELLLSNILDSRMFSDARPNVDAWNWQLELKPQSKHAQIKPIFNFLAAAHPEPKS